MDTLLARQGMMMFFIEDLKDQVSHSPRDLGATCTSKIPALTPIP